MEYNLKDSEECAVKSSPPASASVPIFHSEEAMMPFLGVGDSSQHPGYDGLDLGIPLTLLYETRQDSSE